MNKDRKKLSNDVEAGSKQAHYSHMEIEEPLEMGINCDLSFSITVIKIQPSHTYDADVM